MHKVATIKRKSDQSIGYLAALVVVASLAIVQLLVAIGFLVSGDFGQTLVFATCWLTPVAAVALAFIANSLFFIKANIVLNGIAFLLFWVGSIFFPIWLFTTLAVLHAHYFFAVFASLLNLLPLVAGIYYYQLSKPIPAAG